VGVAPGAKLGVWRVFSCLENTGTLDEFIIEAILRAYDAGVHVISLSLGGGGPWSDDRVPAVKLLNTIATKGVHGKVISWRVFFFYLALIHIFFIVIVAAGNEGHDGAFTVTMPAESVFSVASVINEYKGVSALIEVNGISTPIGKQVRLCKPKHFY
jgi:subtilisin family serine protease